MATKEQFDPMMEWPSPLQGAAVTPLYHRIKEHLSLQIRSGHWQPNQEIPSEPQLCQRYGSSRGTIRRAIEDLVQQGLLYRKRGKGTFVASPKLEGSILGSYRQYMTSGPLDAQSRILRCQQLEASEDIRRLFGLDAGAMVYELERVRFVNQTPVSLQISYLPATLCPGLQERNLSAETLYALLQREYGVTFIRAEEFVEPVIADDYVASHLQIPVGSPVFLIERHSYTFERIGEVRRGHMRGDLYRYRIELR